MTLNYAENRFEIWSMSDLIVSSKILSVRNFFLDCKDIFQFPIVLFGPQVVTIGNIDQLGCQAQPSVRHAHTAFQNGT
jgi:hypothetical protein